MQEVESWKDDSRGQCKFRKRNVFDWAELSGYLHGKAGIAVLPPTRLKSGGLVRKQHFNCLDAQHTVEDIKRGTAEPQFLGKISFRRRYDRGISGLVELRF